MKILVFFLFIHSAAAATLGRVQSSPDGFNEQRFEVKKNSALYVKRSNFFDKKGDLSLGNFKLTTFEKSNEKLARLEEIVEKVKTVDQFLKKKKSSFNDLALKKPHHSYIMLNDYYISQESDLYSELKAIFEELQAMNWNQESGIRISENLKEVITVKKGKETEKQVFNRRFYCKNPEGPSICTYQKHGVFYVTK